MLLNALLSHFAQQPRKAGTIIMSIGWSSRRLAWGCQRLGKGDNDVEMNGFLLGSTRNNPRSHPEFEDAFFQCGRNRGRSLSGGAKKVPDLWVTQPVLINHLLCARCSCVLGMEGGRQGLRLEKSWLDFLWFPPSC